MSRSGAIELLRLAALPAGALLVPAGRNNRERGRISPNFERTDSCAPLRDIFNSGPLTKRIFAHECRNYIAHLLRRLSVEIERAVSVGPCPIALHRGPIAEQAIERFHHDVDIALLIHVIGKIGAVQVNPQALGNSKRQLYFLIVVRVAKL